MPSLSFGVLSGCFLCVFEFCEIIPVSQKTLNTAEILIKKYDFQLFDAIIVATSLEENCEIMSSPDLELETFNINNFYKLFE